LNLGNTEGRKMFIDEKKGTPQKSKRKESGYGKRYGVEFRLRCVKLRLGGRR